LDIRVLGAHNCQSRRWGFISLLVDGVVAIDAGTLGASLSFPEQERLKAILLSHGHYDHIRDVPAVAMNLFLNGATIDIYSTKSTLDTLTTYLLNDTLYPRFQQVPPPKPTVNLKALELLKTETIEGYTVVAVPVNHSAGAVGYQITSPEGKAAFYSGDTGPGLADCWRHILPQLLIIEVTLPNKYEGLAGEAGHLTPSLLGRELASFKKIKGYLPPVVTVHMNPWLEKEIEAEIGALAENLNSSIKLAYEGMELHL